MNKIGINTLDSYKDNVILSKYQKDTKTFDKIIIEKVTMKENDSAYKLINNFVEELKDKLCVISSENNVFDKYNIVYKDEDIKNLTFVKYGLWDAIFQNIFYIDNKFYFYDQEWFEENIPLEFIIYRAFEYSKKLKEIIDAEKIYNQFSISQENLNLFKILDNQLQLKTRSEESWKMHTHFTNISTLQDINSYKISVDKEKEKILEDCKKLLNEKDSRIKFLEDNMESTCNLLREKEEKLSRLENSVSWKLTKPLRKLKGLKK